MVLSPLQWVALICIADAASMPIWIGIMLCIKDDNKSRKFCNFGCSLMWGLFALAVIVGVWGACKETIEKCKSKDTTKTAQVQKFRTTVNNYKTANWNNFARKVK